MAAWNPDLPKVCRRQNVKPVRHKSRPATGELLGSVATPILYPQIRCFGIGRLGRPAASREVACKQNEHRANCSTKAITGKNGVYAFQEALSQLHSPFSPGGYLRGSGNHLRILRSVLTLNSVTHPNRARKLKWCVLVFAKSSPFSPHKRDACFDLQTVPSQPARLPVASWLQAPSLGGWKPVGLSMEPAARRTRGAETNRKRWIDGNAICQKQRQKQKQTKTLANGNHALVQTACITDSSFSRLAMPKSHS